MHNRILRNCKMNLLIVGRKLKRKPHLYLLQRVRRSWKRNSFFDPILIRGRIFQPIISDSWGPPRWGISNFLAAGCLRDERGCALLEKSLSTSLISPRTLSWTTEFFPLPSVLLSGGLLLNLTSLEREQISYFASVAVKRRAIVLEWRTVYKIETLFCDIVKQLDLWCMCIDRSNINVFLNDGTNRHDEINPRSI